MVFEKVIFDVFRVVSVNIHVVWVVTACNLMDGDPALWRNLRGPSS